MLSRLKSLVGGRSCEKPVLESGEQIVSEGRAARMKGFFGGRWGPLVLTNRRLIWYETGIAWPLKPICGELRLSDIASVDKGNLVDLIFGGHGIRIRLKNGRFVKLFEGDGKLNEWIAKLREAALTKQG
jgi:hypothetical protein